MTDSTPPQSSEHKYTSNIDDIKKTIHSDTIHCLLPRPCRETFVISLPSHVSKEKLTEAITKTLEDQMPTTSIFILCTDKITETNGTTSYKIVFLKVLKDLINGFYRSGIKTANFYVGYSENINEYPLLSGPPEDDKIAKCDRENVNLPYKATIQLTNHTEPSESASKKRKTSD